MYVLQLHTVYNNIHLSKNKELTHKSMTRDGRNTFWAQKEKSVYNNNNYISYFLFGMCYWSLDRKYPIKVISFCLSFTFPESRVYLDENEGFDSIFNQAKYNVCLGDLLNNYNKLNIALRLNIFQYNEKNEYLVPWGSNRVSQVTQKYLSLRIGLL